MIAFEHKINEMGLPDKKNIGSSSSDAVLSFVKENIVDFAQNTNHYNDSENKITRDLAVFLNQQAIDQKTVFLFIPQDYENQSRASVDIGLYPSSNAGTFFNAVYYSRTERFFCFEAKILGVNEKFREKEYVIGHIENNKYVTCGGMERFKKCIHGKELEHAALIGYIKKQDFNYWITIINSWIEELVNQSSLWNRNDLLIVKKTSQYLQESESYNLRIEPKNPMPIKLYHLWIDLRNNTDE